MSKWYVVNTRAREEEKAVWNLRRQGFRVYLPRYRKRRRHARRTEWVRRPLFPGYLFVRLDLATERWRAIASTIGVCRLISAGERPVPVPQGMVEAVRTREDSNGLVTLERLVPLRKGAPVRVAAGPFADLVGRFDSVTDEDRVAILLNLLGREVRIQLPLDDIAAYA